MRITSAGLFVTTLLLIVGGYATMVFMDIWMTRWIATSDQRQSEEPPGELSNREHLAFAGVYVGSSFGYAVLVCGGSILFAVGGFRASRAIHLRVVTQLMCARRLASTLHLESNCRQTCPVPNLEAQILVVPGIHGEMAFSGVRHGVFIPKNLVLRIGSFCLQFILSVEA